MIGNRDDTQSDETASTSSQSTANQIGNAISMGMNSLADSVKNFAANVDFNPWGSSSSTTQRPPSSLDNYRPESSAPDANKPTDKPVEKREFPSSIERKLQELSLARAAATASAAGAKESPVVPASTQIEVTDLTRAPVTTTDDGFQDEVLMGGSSRVISQGLASPKIVERRPDEVSPKVNTSAGPPATDMPHPLWVPTE
ncbi:hypothetical protein HDU96_009361 [Phlyctochytrium bullatum]|nr:hypothetical protein HDU96_009361 [Phlyctochytrium bullatum]